MIKFVYRNKINSYVTYLAKQVLINKTLGVIMNRLIHDRESKITEIQYLEKMHDNLRAIYRKPGTNIRERSKTLICLEIVEDKLISLKNIKKSKALIYLGKSLIPVPVKNDKSELVDHFVSTSCKFYYSFETNSIRYEVCEKDENLESEDKTNILENAIDAHDLASIKQQFEKNMLYATAFPEIEIIAHEEFYQNYLNDYFDGKATVDQTVADIRRDLALGLVNFNNKIDTKALENYIIRVIENKDLQSWGELNETLKDEFLDKNILKNFAQKPAEKTQDREPSFFDC